MAKTIEDLFYLLLFVTDILLICLFAIYSTKLRQNNGLLLIGSYSLICLLANLITEFYPFRGIQIMNSFFTLIEYLLFAAFISFFINSHKVRKIIIAGSILFTIFLIFHTFNAPARRIDSVPIGLETILILIYSFYFYYEQMNEESDVFIYSKYSFWIVTGMIIYLAGSFFIYIFANQVERDVLDNFWFVTYAFYVLKNILFSIGILTYVKQTKNPRPEKLYPYLN